MKKKHLGYTQKIIFTRTFYLILGCFGFLMLQVSACAKESDLAKRMDRYNVVWDSPSKEASGGMPLGNGDIAANVYTIENGNLYLLLAKNDAFTYSGDIFKTGRVRISLSPNPFIAGKPYKQTLDLKTGTVAIVADKVEIKIWADANRNVYHIQIDSPNDVKVEAAPDLWKRFDACLFNNFDFTGTEVQENYKDDPTQDVKIARNGNILWYFAVGDRSVFKSDMKYYEVDDMIGKYPDPYLYNTFGNLLESPDLAAANGIFTGNGKQFDIRVHALTKQTPDTSEWINEIEKLASEVIDVDKDWDKHCNWWSEFWDRSWIIASDNSVAPDLREKLNSEPNLMGERTEADGAAVVSQSYNVFRYLMACQSRGKVQAKFNGGLFTQQLRVSNTKRRAMPLKLSDDSWLTHEDDRMWGRRFTYQNQRLLYWPLLRSGDFENMQPFFNYYWNLLPVRKAITKAWFGHDGAYFRENIEPTGAERDCGRSGKPLNIKPGENEGQGYYHSFYFTSGLETVTMMIDYFQYTNDTNFRDEILVPFAREVLLFFDKHYSREENGKLRLDPAMVLESYWIAINPSPDVAGLIYTLDNLLEMKAGTTEDQTNWKRFRNEIPKIPLHEIDNEIAIAPADKYSVPHNAENGELYPVFPFRQFGIGNGSEEIVEATMKHISNKNAFNYSCWTQDQIDWAYAGNAAEAADGLLHRFRVASTQCRFPLYGKEGPDACPDFDHFGAGSTAFQRMLIQESDGKILLLPAWPANWDVDFKQHVSGGAVISGKVVDGELVNWDIEPASRRNEVVVYQLQKSNKQY